MPPCPSYTKLRSSFSPGYSTAPQGRGERTYGDVLSRDKGKNNFSLPVQVGFSMPQNAGQREHLGLPTEQTVQQEGTRQRCSFPTVQTLRPRGIPGGAQLAQWGALITLMLPCRQCSRSLPEGSSVKRAKPEWEDFLMPVSWFRRWRNSSTVEEPSKPTTCVGEGSVPGETSREELVRASGGL